MSEPKAVAESIEKIVPGVRGWHVADERIGGCGLLDLYFAILCTGHGAPVGDDPKAAIRAALD